MMSVGGPGKTGAGEETGQPSRVPGLTPQAPPSQEAEKALEKIQAALQLGQDHALNWHDDDYQQASEFRDALTALRSLRTQHTELREEIERLTKSIEGFKVGAAAIRAMAAPLGGLSEDAEAIVTGIENGVTEALTSTEETEDV